MTRKSRKIEEKSERKDRDVRGFLRAWNKIN